MSDKGYTDNDYGIIIQARTGSTRLENKVMRPFHEKKGILQIMIERLRAGLPDIPLIVATSNVPADRQIYDLAVELGVRAFQGSEDDVLQRFIDAARYFGVRNIIRICSDNPFLDVESINMLIKRHKEHPVDYMSYEIRPGLPVILSHIGIYAEIVRLEALENEAKLTEDIAVRQHVTYYIYKHPGQFEVEFLKVPLSAEMLTDIRLTVDTEADFALAQELYEKFIENSWSVAQLIDHVRSKDELLEKMKELIDNNPK